MLIHLTKNAVLWLNALPAQDGISTEHSPRYIMTGWELYWKKHAVMEFGAYAQCHEEHTNQMIPRTIGAICLGPTGNVQGGHWFMSLATGARICRHRWTELPLPRDAIDRVNQLGKAQQMPQTMTYVNRWGREIPNDLLDYYEDDDATEDEYQLSEHDHSDMNDKDELTLSSNESSDESSSSSDDDDGDPDIGGEGEANSVHDDTQVVPFHEEDHPNHETDEQHDIEIDDEAQSTATEEIIEPNTVEASGESTGVRMSDDESVNMESTGVPGLTEEDAFRLAEQHGHEAAVSDQNTVRPQHTRRSTRSHDYDCSAAQLDTEYLDELIAKIKAGDVINLLSAQMSAKKGLKVFGEAGANGITKELEQILYRKVMHGVLPCQLNRKQKRAALKYLMFLKEKRCGKIKGWGCADGCKQRVYKTKDETSAPTIYIESLFLLCMLNAKENRYTVTCDVPGAFMQADIDELIHLRLDGELAELLIKVDASYQKFLTYEGKTPVIYTQLSKALYGTLQAALLFWRKLQGFLVDQLGFTPNPYDQCVVNKTIQGTQCTVGWHVDDIMVSHVDKSVVEGIISQFNSEYGVEAPLTITRGKIHDYLGMKIDFSTPGQVKFTMDPYIDTLIQEIPEDLVHGPASTPAGHHLFQVNQAGVPLPEGKRETFHHLVAKLLYLSKRTRPDLQTAVAFLTTRVQHADEDDWKKLGHCLRYLRNTRGLPLILSCDSPNIICWWIDASFGVHPKL